MRRTGFEAWVVAGLLTAILASCDQNPQQVVENAARSLPRLAGAKALSQHYVEVTFTEPVGAAAATPDLYRITDPAQGELAVNGAIAGDDPRQVILTTGAQAEVQYLLQMRDPSTPGSPTAQGSLNTPETSNVAAFPGTTGSEPALRSAIALSNTTLLLTFNNQMDITTTQNIAFYDISSPDLNVTAASLAADLISVTLTTTAQQNILYPVKVTNVKAKGGSGTNAYINPDFSTATFYGIPVVDNIQPKLAGAQATGDTSVLLSFTEPMNANAADPSNYSLSPLVGITGAALNDFKTQVTLTTFPITAGVTYTVTASTNLKDLASPIPNPIDPDLVDRSADFTLAGTPAIVGDDEPPHVVNAISTSDRTVVVTFSKPMGASADLAENYRITGPETAFLFVTDALRSTDYTAVRLVTSPQADYVYTVHVGNVLDLGGRPIAAPDSLLAPPDGVDPSSAQFFGTPPDSIDKQTDTDGDGFADWFETAGWEIVVEPANGGQKRAFVTSDPYNPDTDGDGFTDGEENAHNWDPRTNDADGLNDGAECSAVNGTNPEDADTDDDLRNDGAELAATLNPLRKDKRISVTLVNVVVVDDCDEASLEGMELEGNFKITKPDATVVTLKTFDCADEEGACGVRDCCQSEGDAQACPGEDFSVNVNSGNFVLRDGESFVLFNDGAIKDHDDLDCGNHTLDDTIGTMNESVPFSASLSTTKAVTVGTGDCQVIANYTITIVN